MTAVTTNGPVAEDGMTNAALRTRAAVIGAAFEMLPANPRVALNEIAERAGVGRSTLHRHFVDRDDVVVTLARHIRDLAVAAIKRAGPEYGTPREALQRIVDGLIDLGPALVWMHEHVTNRLETDLETEFRKETVHLEIVLNRASQPGDTTPLDWRHRVFWEVLRLGADFVDDGMPRQEVIEMILRTLFGGVVVDLPTGEGPAGERPQ